MCRRLISLGFFVGSIFFLSVYAFSANENKKTPTINKNAITNETDSGDDFIGPCCTSKNIVGKPFTFKGRACYYNGHPLLRIWRMGTNRILGVRQDDKENPCAPDYLLKAIGDPFTKVYGVFTVYPISESKPGEMQSVCVESVKITKIVH